MFFFRKKIGKKNKPVDPNKENEKDKEKEKEKEKIGGAVRKKRGSLTFSMQMTISMREKILANEGKKATMSGVVQKMGEINRSWKERFCVIQKDNLVWYQQQGPTTTTTTMTNIGGNRKSSKLPTLTKKKSLMLREIHARVAPGLFPELPGFEVITKNRVYRFIAPTQFEMIKWIAALNLYSEVWEENSKLQEIEEDIRSTVIQNQVNKFGSIDRFFEKVGKEGKKGIGGEKEKEEEKGNG